jgi:beta-phosphoglucomutase family hydrolase
MMSIALDAAIFDLDGVLTFTAEVHAAAWKELFDRYLQSRLSVTPRVLKPFDVESDYKTYVDGRLRNEGVEQFLQSRGITLPYGTPSDSPERETICGLANRKDAIFLDKINWLGVKVDHNAVRFVSSLQASGVRIAVASSSRNTKLILQRAGLADRFDAVADGILSDRLHLSGKPAPDLFLKALELLGFRNPSRAFVVEDAIAGVEAGRAARFGLVIGVDRGGKGDSLRAHGADWIVQDFQKITVEQVMHYFRSRLAQAI